MVLSGVFIQTCSPCPCGNTLYSLSSQCAKGAAKESRCGLPHMHVAGGVVVVPNQAAPLGRLYVHQRQPGDDFDVRAPALAYPGARAVLQHHTPCRVSWQKGNQVAVDSGFFVGARSRLGQLLDLTIYSKGADAQAMHFAIDACQHGVHQRLHPSPPVVQHLKV